MTPDLFLDVADAVWVRDGDGISVPARGPAGGLSIFVTRAALAAVVGKDRSEISAETARSILEDHQTVVARAAQRQYARVPGSATLNIDYAEIEDRS